ALSFVYCGPGHPATAALGDAVGDASAVSAALDQLARLPALRRRRCCPAMRRWRESLRKPWGRAKRRRDQIHTEGGNGRPRATGAQPGAGFGEGIAVSETSASS